MGHHLLLGYFPWLTLPFKWEVGLLGPRPPPRFTTCMSCFCIRHTVFSLWFGMLWWEGYLVWFCVLFFLVGIQFHVASVGCKFVYAGSGWFWLWALEVLFCGGLWCGISVVLVIHEREDKPEMADVPKDLVMPQKLAQWDLDNTNMIQINQVFANPSKEEVT